MNWKRNVYIVLCLLLILVSWQRINTFLENEERKDLAERLDVDINAYPKILTFPINYFFVTLKPGVTSIREVHEIVTDYERVLNCYGQSEVYYYYSENDDDALRFKIVYDAAGKYAKLLGEDNNSSTLYVDGCVPGLLNE